MTNLFDFAIACGLLSLVATVSAADDTKTAAAVQKAKSFQQKMARTVGKASAKAADADRLKRLEAGGGNNRVPVLSDITWDLLSDIAFRLLSGNKAELLSDNEPELLSGNEAELLSGNEAELLSGNEAELFSDNETNLLSENEVEFLSGNDVNLLSGFSITINVQNSGNKGSSAAPAEKKTAFKALDRDNDNRLTLKEFQRVQAGRKAPKLRKRFDKWDENADGFLTSAEFQSPQSKKGKKRKAGRELTGD